MSGIRGIDLALKRGLYAVTRQDGLDQDTEDRTALNAVFLLLACALVFSMQIGFAVLTAGSVRTKNTKNVLLKNACDCMVTSIGYYLFGYAFAYGDSANPFIGHSNFALSGVATQDYLFVTFQLLFAATACTIVSGCVCERISFYAYLGYAFLLTSFVYPVISHWVWSGDGWLNGFPASPGQPSRLFGQGAIDFAGCSVVHMVGGFSGLIGCAVIGPRHGRFDSEGNPIPMPGHSAALTALGAFLLWFGWLGFNPGSALVAATEVSDPVVLSDGSIAYVQPHLGIARASLNTILAAGSGGLTALLIVRIRDRINDLTACLNGMLAGLVSITSGCAFVEVYAAIVIAMIGSAIYLGTSKLELMLKLDDPLEAWPIHGAVGMWGIFAEGLFSRELHQAEAGFLIRSWGAFYGGGGRLLAAEVITILVVIGFVSAIMGPFFLILKAVGLLRISADAELLGNDFEGHGGFAYPEDVIETVEAEETVKELPPNFLNRTIMIDSRKDSASKINHEDV
eukprot:CAMPEP_0182441126 /NCGR_PEP_ID=MMETSP1172-20130603/71_1 /TAXON_ID=708627 /ORGANISM="Timspurckia oligopyrenoides, Strain CCMP3278" /LENGTH=510 /DNA_ID=CAMNT_0024635283 /DNA_START=423 /DNA_END=1955 /DNA_ORIENTATION=-